METIFNKLNKKNGYFSTIHENFVEKYFLQLVDSVASLALSLFNFMI